MTTRRNLHRPVAAAIHVNPDGTGTVEMAGRIYPLAEASMRAARHAAIGLILYHAANTGQQVHVTARDPHSAHHLLVTADGDVLPAAPGTIPVLMQPGAFRSVSRRPQLLGAGLLLIAGATALTIPLLRHDPAPPTIAQPSVTADAAEDLPMPLTLAGTAAITAPTGLSKPAGLPATRTSARWTRAAHWQAVAEAKAAARRRATQQRQATAPRPRQPAADLAGQPAPVAPRYPRPAPHNPARPPTVRIYPDPQIHPN